MAGAGRSDAAVAFAITVLIFTFSLLRQIVDERVGEPLVATALAAFFIFFVALGVVKWYRGG